MSGCTTIKEWVAATQGSWVDRTYTDDEVVDIFGPSEADYNLPLALLRRAQAAEAEVERLRNLLGERT